MSAKCVILWTVLVSVSPLVSGDTRVSIKAYPGVIFEGSAVRLTCSVARHPDNRRLRLDLEGVRASTRDLDGENSAITHSIEVGDVPCLSDDGRVTASCTVEPGGHRAAVDVIVTGCKS